MFFLFFFPETHLFRKNNMEFYLIYIYIYLFTFFPDYILCVGLPVFQTILKPQLCDIVVFLILMENFRQLYSTLGTEVAT